MPRTECLNWETIARAEVQPHRLAILEAMLRDPPDGDPGWSTTTVADLLGVPLERLSYHVRVLADRELIEPVATRHVRGARQIYYRLRPGLA